MRRGSSALIVGMLTGVLSATAALAQPQDQSNIPTVPAPTPPVAPGAPNQAPAELGQPLARGLGVTARPRPEYDPLGVRLGSFFLYPRVDIDETYNDNVFATSSNRRDDFITTLSPTIQLLSNWTSHLIDLRAGLSNGWYSSDTSENYTDYFGSAGGRLDVDRYHAFLGNLKYEHLHEERDSPDATTAATHPVEFNVYTANAGFSQRGLRIGYDALFEVRREEYEAARFASGALIPESLRDVNTYTPSLRLSYQVAPNYELFVRGAVNWRDYDHRTPLGTGIADLNRNSWGYRVDVGGTIDLTGVTYAELFAGYLSQQYDDSRLPSIDGFDVGARVVWNVTQLTSVAGNVSRRVQDSNIFSGVGSSSPGYLRSDVGLSVDHELFRNLLLNGRVNYENDDYEGIDRTDNRFDVGGGLRYLINHNVYLGGSYTYTRRTSSGAAATGEFNRNLFLLRLGLQM